MNGGGHAKTWTAAMEKRLVELMAEELSFLGIAGKLNQEFGLEISRNACIGKARRMSQPPRKKPYIRPQRPQHQAPKRLPPKVDAPIPPKPRPARSQDGLDIYQLGYGDCRWPLAEMQDPPPYRYCGQQTVEGTSWCKHHGKRALIVPRVRWE